MSKQNSINTVREIFESSFDRAQFIYFVKNLLNEYEDAPITRTGNLIPDAYSDYVSKYERIGKYEDTEEKRIDILIVYLKKETSIERARSMQRNFIAGYLKSDYGSRSLKDAALVAFVAPNKEDWRFSLVKLEVKLDADDEGKMKLIDEFTPAKRWSFLVGSHEKSHTAQRQFQPILEDIENNPTLEDLEGAFNIEKVTDEFFREYRRLFIDVKSALDKAVKANPKTKADFESKGIDTVNLAKKLMGQIIFLYYLQKKGWFGVPKDGQWGEGSKNFLRELFDKNHGDYEDFFNDVLEPLFYDALRMDRSDEDYYYKRFKCKIPFLNGGLFDPMGNYDWEKTVINLSNTLFSNKTKGNPEGDGILDVFDLYNFTVNEDEPFEKEVAIDPELLGKAYEKFNAIRPDNYDEFLKALKSGKKGDESKFNKQYGVYYTPREIVHYMCQQSLINYLYSELNSNVVYQSLGDDKLDMFGNAVKSGQLDLSVAQHPMAEISKEAIALLIQHGESLREHEVQAAVKETKTYSPLIHESIRNNAALIDEKLAAIKVCDPAVGSGAFPVGMMSEIVRARDVLKTWTKSKKTVYDFKRECIENSLYGVDIDAGAVEIAKLRLWLSLIVDEDNIQNIKPLPNLDYKIVCGNSLLGVEKNLFNVNLFTELETQKPLYFNATNSTKKQEYKKKIDGLIDQITDGNSQFDFEIHFSEVFHEKSGFDILIANPPYVGQKGHKEIFQEIAKTELGKQFHQRRMDLFYFFIHLTLNLAHDKSQIAFITTNYFVTATYADKLRKDLFQRASFRNLINFNELRIFESAQGQHNLVTLFEKGKNNKIDALTATTKQTGFATPFLLNSILSGSDPNTEYTRVLQSDIYQGKELYINLSGNDSSALDPKTKILSKISTHSELLGSVLNIFQGIVTGADKVSPKHISKFNIKANAGDGIFVLSSSETKALNLTAKERQFIRPWFKNSDVQRYICSQKSNAYVIYRSSKHAENDIPNIKKHLSRYKIILVNRNVRAGEVTVSQYDDFVKGKNEIDYVMIASAMKAGNYYCLSYARDESLFDEPKIVAPQRSTKNTFGYNNISWYAASDVFFITEKDKTVMLKYVLALLNSHLYYFWLYYRGKRKGEILELIAKPLSEIPIKRIPVNEQKPFIELVDRILAAKGGNPEGGQADTSKLEREIDQLVYQLYGLTEDEVKIVEGKVNQFDIH